MARNLSFGSILSLDARGFNAGLNAARNAFMGFSRSIMSTAAALGASLGFANILRGMKDTATQLNVARATLKNVSKDMAEYSDNLAFTRGLASAYKQDLIVLTDGFAKFHAAAEGTNISLEDQKKIFAGLTQAATYYHMSSERTQNMLVAVEQMMSKGKITAEELRRQLGNNLPGAYAKMAQAAMDYGKTHQNTVYASIKSFADFESAMKKGQIGVELLTQFVDNLNGTTKKIDLNSLQLASNELKNTWTEFVESSEFEQTLTKLYQLAANILTWLRRHLEDVKGILIGIAGVVISEKLIPAIANIRKALKALTWSNWATAAVSAVWTIISVMVRLDSKIRNVNADLDKLAKITDTADALFAYREKERQLMDIVSAGENKYNNPQSKAKWDRYQEMQALASGEQKGKWGSTKDMYRTELNLFRMANAELIRYFESENTLSAIQDKIKELEKKYKEENPEVPYTGGTMNTDLGGGIGGKHEKTVKDILDDYRKKTEALGNQQRAGSKTAEEAEEELGKLSVTAWENITAFRDFREELKKLGPEAEELANQIEGTFYNSKDKKAAEDAKKEADKIAKKWNEFNIGRAERGNGFQARDTRFDYRLKPYEILRAEQEQWEKISADLQKDIDYITEHFNELGEQAPQKLKELSDALIEAKNHTTNLKDAADFAEYQKELIDLEKKYNEGLGKGILGVAQDFERVAKGWKQLKEELEDEDATGLDKFIAILNEMIQLTEVLNGLIETFNTLQTISDNIAKAKNATELAGLGEQVAVQGILNGEKTKEVALTQAAAIAEGEEAAAAIAATGAKSGEAVANATNEGAKLPFPANLAAIALGVGAVIAALASIKKYAGGGIVSGSRHGDRNLAAVNGGEMILNSGQQARLWNMLNGKGSAPSSGGELTFRLRGSDIIGAIENTRAKRRG